MDTKALQVALGAGVGALLGMGWGYAVRRMTVDKEKLTGFIGAREGALLGAFMGGFSVALPVYSVGEPPADDSGREEATELLRLTQADRQRLAPRASQGARLWLNYWAARNNSHKLGLFSLTTMGLLLAGTTVGYHLGKTDEDRVALARRGELASLVGAALIGTWVLTRKTKAQVTRDDIYNAAYGNGLAYGNNTPASPMRKRLKAL